MDTKNSTGIWMDHSTAKFIGIDGGKEGHAIHSKFSFDTRKMALNKSENLMHNKEQQMHEAFYKEIAGEILKYEHVLIFGPTNAKVELHNYLKKDLHFKDIQIDIEAADTMTDNEMVAFVKAHFAN